MPTPPPAAAAMQARLRDEALFGRLPLLRGEREYSTRGILATGFAYAVAAWCFLIGGYAANVVTAGPGVVALVAGSIIGVSLSAAAAALACNRYGLEQIDFTKTCFGQRGSMLVLTFYVINQLGWTGMILVMFGRGAQNVLGALGLPASTALVQGLVLVGMAVAYAIVVFGVHILNVFNSIVTPGLIIVTTLLFYVLFRDTSWAALMARPPLAPLPQPGLGYVVAFEYGLGAGFSWWPGIGFLTRNTDTQRNSFYPQVLTMGLGMGVVCCTGLLAGLLFRTYDPTQWMVQVGGPVFGVLALALVAIANISASAMMMYTAALGLRHLRFARGMPWPRLTALAFIPVLCYAIWPTELYDNGSAFLTYNATMFAPISGILFIDYVLLRRGRLNLSQVFEGDRRGDYWFWRGCNPVAIGCMVLGQGLYVWLLDPVSNTPHGPVAYLTATGPAVLLPMLLYALLMRWLIIPRRLGGYDATTTPRPLIVANL